MMDVDVLKTNGVITRYYIKAENGCFWTGEAWSHKHKKTLYFHDEDSAAKEKTRLKIILKKTNTVKLETTLSISIQNYDKINLNKLKKYMLEAIELKLDYDVPRPSELANSNMDVVIHWGRLRKKS